MKEIKISEASKSHRDVLSNSSCPFFVWGNLSLVDPAVPWMLKSGQSVIVDTFSFLNLDSSSSPPPSSPTSPPTSSPPPPAPLSRRPPFCHLNYKHLHCEDCGRCAYLCGEHHGCYCVSDNAIFCDVCYCEYGVRYTNPKDKLCMPADMY